MEQPVSLARHLAQLVWLLLYQPAGVEEQKAALRSLVFDARGGAVHLALHGDTLQANDLLVAAAFTGVAELVRQMELHGLALITVDANAPAAALLGIARIIAGMPVSGDGGLAAEAKRVAQDITSIRFAARPPQPRASRPMAEMDFGDVYDDPVGEALARVTPPPRARPTPSGGSASVGMWSQFAAPREPTESADGLLEQLDTAIEPNQVARLLDDLTVIAERAAKEGRGPLVADILLRIVRREPQHEVFDTRRLFVMTLNRLFKPGELLRVVHELPRQPARRDELVAILVRAGEHGAAVLIERLCDQAHQRDRRVYFDALLQLKSGIPALLHMLSDHRWFAVRNAAELLGEMNVREAEPQLSRLLQHEDERVRRAAAVGLIRLGSPRGMEVAQQSLSSSSISVRMDAVHALAARRDSKSVPMLLLALDDEKDADVQSAILLSLGKLATADAVNRLIRTAEGEKSLFRKKPVELRVAAIHALSEARTEEATNALRELREDKDPVVREAAGHGLKRTSRKTAAVQQPE